jgi:hypothetical protein
VFPPYRMVCLPGTAIEPLVPQNFILIVCCLRVVSWGGHDPLSNRHSSKNVI